MATFVPGAATDRRIEKLHHEHQAKQFDCGDEHLNRFLIRYALQSQQAGSSQTYVGLLGERVIGYYSLAVGEVSYAGAPARLTKGLARHPVPIMLLARLAVEKSWQRQGVGKALLRDALQRTLQAADIAGIRALAVHAKDEAVKQYYERFGFIPSPTDPLHLLVLLKDLKALL